VPLGRPAATAGRGEGMSIPPHRSQRGYRTLPHTADLRIEAWAPTREACLAEGVAGLVATFADTAKAEPEWTARSGGGCTRLSSTGPSPTSLPTSTSLAAGSTVAHPSVVAVETPPPRQEPRKANRS
jgi:hypothetical protein